MTPPQSIAASLPRAAVAPSTPWRDCLELTKPGLSLLSVLTALAGYFAARPEIALRTLLALALGTTLCAGGAAALNQFLEADTDARMRRTRERPLPAGRLPSGAAFVLGTGLCFVGVALLLSLVNGLAAACAGLTIITYLALYTPAKRTSRWSTEIGAVAGAFPPLIGWTAAENALGPLGWILFGVLLFWQIPHFMAIAWLCRDDYAAAGFPMLAVRDSGGRRVARYAFVAALLLGALGLAPAALGLSSWAYGAAATLLGGWFAQVAWRFMRGEKTASAARRLFFVSIIDLPLLLGALVADRVLFH
ncbi:MAG TPA: heme o synthase [Opitutaceae bacterium]|nr:heme o synthase [Opitutaceae bacterium]